MTTTETALPRGLDIDTVRAEAARTYELDRAHVFHSWSAQAQITPMTIVAAEGAYVWDGEGNRLLDFSGQLVFTKGTRSFTLSAMQAEWELKPQDEEGAAWAGSHKKVPGTYFLLTDVSSTSKVKVDKKKKTRTTTTTMSAYVNLAVDPLYADEMNKALRTSVFNAGMLLGYVETVVKTTAACKNTACTK